MTLIERPSDFIRDGIIDYVIYPVFPPGRRADAALRTLEGPAPSD